jgi:Zn-dependent M28 family amino/carboxypeptidase
MKLHGVSFVVAGTAALFASASSAIADSATDTLALRTAITVENVRDHQQELQTIADDNGGTRVSGSAGYDASADYVFGLLEAAGYNVTRQQFSFPFFQENTPPEFEQISPTPTTYAVGGDFLTMEYSGSGNVTAPIQPTNDIVIPPGAEASSSNSGCEDADFPASTSGSIALIQRGTCTFFDKALNAQEAGAVGVIIFNEGQPGRQEVLSGTLGGLGINIPVIGISFALGESLNAAGQTGSVSMRIKVDAFSESRDTSNIIAETSGGRADRIVVVGAHLDSVAEGPGINDNGSGSAAILEIALQMAQLEIAPYNKVRFAFWGAEEAGLLGAEHYVSQLSKQDIKNIALNLNFDMLGSPNFVRFVYDGDGSDTETAGPNGSKNIEKVFLDYFRLSAAAAPLATEPTAFDGRSDYGPFIAVGIPAGGLFSGAEEIKTAEEADVYGGMAGVAYDPCYHQACDDFSNNSDESLDQLTDAAAHAVLTFAMTTSAVNGTAKAQLPHTGAVAPSSLLYRGSNLQK